MNFPNIQKLVTKPLDNSELSEHTRRVERNEAREPQQKKESENTTMTTFISLAISDTMFPTSADLEKRPLTADAVRRIVESGNIESAVNKSHTSTIDVIRRKFAINLPIPAVTPKVSLQSGDTLIVIQAQLPRLAEGEVHTPETVENARIAFSEWSVK